MQPQNPYYIIADICNGLHALYSKGFIILPPSALPLRGSPDHHPLNRSNLIDKGGACGATPLKPSIATSGRTLFCHPPAPNRGASRLGCLCILFGVVRLGLRGALRMGLRIVRRIAYNYINII